MNRKIFILKNKSGDIGVAKLTKSGNRSILSINLEKTSREKKTCKIIQGTDLIEVGSFYKKRTDFNLLSVSEADNIIIEEKGVPVAWSGDQINNEEIEREPESPPQDVTFENFFGGGFEWNRIRGNYILYDYSIIHHILSNNNVYRAINQTGYYCVGKCERDGVTIIAVAIPLIKTIQTPFSDFSADIYNIKSGKINFHTLCVGIDKTGEFFIHN